MSDRASMCVTVIDAHPDPDKNRFCHALADAYEVGARRQGHDVRRIDIAALEFPTLRTAADFHTGTPVADIVAAQEAIRWADHIAIIYPLWLGTMPAMLKAFLEQVFRPGFGIAAGSEGWPKPLLKGRSARLIVTMGMPALVYRWFFRAHGLKNLERNILKLTGISPVRETLLGGVEAVSFDKRTGWLATMRQLGGNAR